MHNIIARIPIKLNSVVVKLTYFKTKDKIEKTIDLFCAAFKAMKRTVLFQKETK